jgi:hypothetical protein
MVLSPRSRAQLLSWSGCSCALVLAASVAELGACDASGEVEGGEPFDGGVTTTATTDAGGTTTKASNSCAGPDAGTGSTFTDLYRDYFGPSGGASCSGSVGNCHGETTGVGALGSGGFVCGASQSDCYTGMHITTADLLSASDTATPANSGLVMALRKETPAGTNNMPFDPPSTCVFTDGDIARITAWVGAGAPND